MSQERHVPEEVKNSKFGHRKIFGIVGLFTLAVILVIFTVKPQHKTELPDNQQTAQTPVLNYYHMPNEITAIFVHEISQEDALNRGWPTVNIMRRAGDNPPELLASLGKVGEYPGVMRVTPDRKYLFISLETKLIRLDLATKEIRDFFTPAGNILDFTFSPDEKKILVLDQGDPNAHVLDIETGVLDISKGKAPMDSIFLWRDDDMVLGFASKGEGGWSVNLNLKTGREELGTDGTYGSLSRDGYLKAIPLYSNETDKLVKSCYDMGGYSAAYISVVNLKTGNEIERFGDEQHYTGFVSFSPDNLEVLYFQEDIVSDQDDCNIASRESLRTYYKMDINGTRTANKPIMVEDPLSLITGWGVDHYGVREEYKFDDQNRNFSIVYGDFVIAQSETFVRLIDAWYSEDGDIANLNSPSKPAVDGWKVYDSRKWNYRISYPSGSTIRDQVNLVDFHPPNGGIVSVDYGCYITFERSTSTKQEVMFKGKKATEYSIRLDKELDPTERLYAIVIGFNEADKCFEAVMTFDDSRNLPQLRQMVDSLEFY